MSSPVDRSRAFTAASVPENYQRYLAPAIFEPWAERLLDAAGVRSGDAVLDVACGTGVVSRAAARRVGTDGRVTAADISPAMLGFAAAQHAADGAGQIEFVEGPAAAIPVPDASFDAVVCQQGLQFFPDRDAAARELRRAARPGGTVAVAVWAAGHHRVPFDDFVGALVALGVEPPFERAFDPKTFGIAPDVIESLLAGAGLREVEVAIVEQEVSWPDGADTAKAILGTPYGPLVEAMPNDRRAQLFEDLSRRFGAGAPLRATSYAVLGTGRAG
jgi:ubiquinone/menaquinone biosynthesis C-methylase UbiE